MARLGADLGQFLQHFCNWEASLNAASSRGSSFYYELGARNYVQVGRRIFGLDLGLDPWGVLMPATQFDGVVMNSTQEMVEGHQCSR